MRGNVIIMDLFTYLTSERSGRTSKRETFEQSSISDMSCYSGIIYWNIYWPTTLYACNNGRSNSYTTPIIQIYSNKENKALEFLVQVIIFINLLYRRGKTGCFYLYVLEQLPHLQSKNLVLFLQVRPTFHLYGPS